MKILCPTDFSPCANNGIEYAARLASKMGATLTLLNVQRIQVADGVNMFAVSEPDSLLEASRHEKALMDMSVEISKTFNIICTHEVITTMGGFENVIAQEAGKFSLTVIGTNGTDSNYQFFFGSHSFRIARHTNAPVIIVPDEIGFRDLKRVVFASDYNDGDTLLLNQLKTFTKSFNAQLNVIHVSKEDNELSRTVYQSFCSMTGEAFDFDQNLNFTRLVAEDEALAIDSYMNKSDADLLAIYFQPHGIIYRIFHENLIKKITALAGYPVMIFHK